MLRRLIGEPQQSIGAPMKTLLPLTAAVVLAGFSPHTAFAWGPEGHALVGKIADQLLAGTPTGAKVDRILELYTLEDAAKWPDCVRSVVKNPGGTFEFVEGKYTAPCTAFFPPQERARMADYAKRNWDTFPYLPGHPDHEAYHFADIPIEDGSYAPSDIGASTHDVVHAIDAAIAKLQHRSVPAPFSIKDDKEAILLLAHFVGDIHQPLHVGAIYLDASGTEVNPISEAQAEADTTAGGNLIAVDGGELHGEWDSISKSLETTNINTLVSKAKALPHDAGPVDGWAAAWASESVVAAAQAFTGVTFTPAGPHKWKATFADRAAYQTAEEQEKDARVVQAGARLAAVLKAIWP